MASSTSLESTPETTVTSPMRTGSTKCTLPWIGLLVVDQAGEQVSGGDAVDRRNGAVAVDEVQNFDAVLGGEMAGRFGQVDGGAHAPRDGLAVEEARCTSSRLRGRGRRCGRNSGCGGGRLRARRSETTSHFMRHGFGDDVVDGLGLARQHVVAPFGEVLKSAGSRMMPALTISYRPARYSRSRQGVEEGGVDEHGERLVEAADQVLAADEIDAGLAADRPHPPGRAGWWGPG